MPKKISDLTINNTPSASDVIPYSNGADATDRGLNISYFHDKIQDVDDKTQDVDDKTSMLTKGLIQTTGEDEALVAPKLEVKHPAESVVQPKTTLPANIAFIFDRQQAELVSDAGRGGGFPSGGWKGIFDSKGIKFSMSLVNQQWNTQPNFDSSQMSLQDALDLQSDGFEIQSHLRANDVINANYDEALNVIATIKGIHEDLGFEVKTANWFGGISTSAYRSAVREHYKACADVQGVLWLGKPINQFNFGRRSLDQDGVGGYNTWTPLVDTAVANDLPLVFYGHAYQDNWYDTKYDDDGAEDVNGEYGWEKIVKLIDYIQAKAGYNDLQHDDAVIISTVDELIDLHGNVIDAGIPKHASPENNTLPYTRISRDGKMSSSALDRLRHVKFTEDGLNDSVLLGIDAGKNSQSKTGLTHVGHRAGEGNVTEKSTLIGYFAGINNSGTGSPVYIGDNAGNGATEQGCVGVGRYAGRESQAIRAVSIGYNAGYLNTSHYSVNIGYKAGEGDSGNTSVNIGRNAGLDSSGIYNIGIGAYANYHNSANNVVSIGYEAGSGNTESGVFIIKQDNVSSTPLIKGYFSDGRLITGAPGSAINDSLLGAGRMSFYLDETTDKLMVKAKYSDGTTVKTGEVALI